MRKNRLILLNLFAAATVVALSIPQAGAQSYKVELDKPQFEDLQSPEFGGGKSKSFDPREWLEIEVGFKVQMSPEPTSQTADSVLVKWYVAVENPDRTGTYFLLTKDITHVNVPLNEEMFSSVYLSPASVKRITGSDRAGKGSVFSVGVEVLVNGEVKAQESTKLNAGWWSAASERISRSDVVPLLNKSESAFAHMWWDRYAEILPERR